MSEHRELYEAALGRAHAHSLEWLDTVRDRHVGPRATVDDLLSLFGDSLSEGPHVAGGRH